MSKLSQRIVAMATCILRKPPEQTSPSGHAVAMMLAHAAWNHAVQGGPDFNVEFIRRWIRPEAERNPGCLQELKSPDLLALLHEMVSMKRTRYPRDRRVVLACEFTPQRTLRVNSMVRAEDLAHHDQEHEQAQG